MVIPKYVNKSTNLVFFTLTNRPMLAAAFSKLCNCLVTPTRESNKMAKSSA